MNKYVFKPYSDEFPKLFEREKKRIASALPGALAIEHIGSTAVPELGGKGIIDIGIAVDRKDLSSACETLQELGYEYRPTFSTPDRLYFIIFLPDEMEGTRRYHVHLTHPGNKEWAQFLRIRDYLRQHPEERKMYAEVKQRAAQDAAGKGEEYRKIKADFLRKFVE